MAEEGYLPVRQNRRRGVAPHARASVVDRGQAIAQLGWRVVRVGGDRVDRALDSRPPMRHPCSWEVVIIPPVDSSS